MNRNPEEEPSDRNILLEEWKESRKTVARFDEALLNISEVQKLGSSSQVNNLQDSLLP